MRGAGHVVFVLNILIGGRRVTVNPTSDIRSYTLTPTCPITLELLPIWNIKSHILIIKGGFLRNFMKNFFKTLFNTASSAAPPPDSTVSEDAGIEPGTIATSTLALRNSTTRLHLIHDRLDLIQNRPDLIHIPLNLIHIRLNVIHIRLNLIHIRLDLIHTRLGLIHTRLNLIHNSAKTLPHSARSHALIIRRSFEDG